MTEYRIQINQILLVKMTKLMISLIFLHLVIHQVSSIADYNYPYTYHHCEDPGIPDNGYLTSADNTDDFSVGTTVLFVCNGGYVLHGSMNITCEQGLYEAYWTDDTPVCIPAIGDITPGQRCGKAPKPGPHAVTITSNSAVIEYDCRHDHVPVSGDRVLYCYKKTWHGEPLECRRKAECPVVEPNQHILYNTSGHEEDDVVLFTCQKGYSLIGSPSITCLSTGLWTSQWPSCTPSSCPYPSGVSNGQTRLITSTEAKYQCYTGYNLIGSDKAWCGHNGTWMPAPPECRAVDCGELTDPVNGLVHYSATTYNHRAYYFCVSGHNLVGSSSRRCGSDGQWTYEAPVCQPKLCPDPTVPSHGRINITAPSVGGEATYSCKEGYRLMGTATRSCLTSAQWSGSPPSCIVIDCGPLSDPVDGKVELSSTKLNAVATYNCKRNKHLVHGTITRVCQANGTWSGREPQCVSVVSCEPLNSIANGKVEYSSTSVSSIATYSCNNGYTMVGPSATVVCNSYGEWEGPVPYCAVNCGHPPSIRNGQAAYSSTNFASVATYTCRKGYDQNGEVNTVECQANGEWTRPSTSCEDLDCGEPPSIPKGEPVYNSTTFLSKVSYLCQRGYILSKENPALVCLSNRKWFGGVPNCEAVDCGIPESINNGAITYSSTRFSSTAMYTCDIGYRLVGDSSVRTCNENGIWEGSLPSCVVDCGILDPPNNNTVISYSSNSTLVNSTASYSCLLGYVNPLNITTRLCTQNGIWTEPEPVCEPIDCGPLQSPLNGLVRLSKSTTLASPARYSCNIGFRRVGVEFRICLVNGQWSGDPPTCQIIDCGSLDNPVNGLVQFNTTTFTSRALYSCNTGFMITPVGTDTDRICRNDGEWSGQAPSCQLINCGELSDPVNGMVDVTSTLHGGIARYSCNTGYTIDGPNNRTCGDQGMWSGTEPSCQTVNCGDPGILVNGERTFFGTTYRLTATFFCNDGFTMTGDGTRRCEADGQWTGQLPQCTANVPTCELLDPPEHGYIVLQATVPGSTAVYGCNEGYERVGSPSRMCEDSLSWTGEAPTCERITRCPELVTPDHSRRIGNSNEIGTVVYFVCEDGYDTVGSNARRCQENLEWSGIHPSCALRNVSCNGSGSISDGNGRQCDCINGELVNCCRQRQDWLSLSEEEKLTYMSTVKMAASSDTLYSHRYVELMQLYKDGSGTPVLSYSTSSTQFLPWHRYFLQQYEDLLRMINPSVTLPYWDWTLFSTNPYLNPIFSPDNGFGNSSDSSDNCVQDGPFRETEFTISSVSGGRCLQRLYLPGLFLTRDQLANYIINLPSSQFTQFFSLLTVPYVTIRCAVGGTMCSLDATAPTDDPLHIPILAYFDSLWDRWQAKSVAHKLARYSNDNSAFAVLSNSDDAVKTPADYHDNSNLPYGTSVCYTDPVNLTTNHGNKKRSVKEISCISEDDMAKLSLSSAERHSIRGACRLLYSYIARQSG